MSVTIPSPLLSAAQVESLGPVRLLHVPGGDESPAKATVVPIKDWVARAMESRSGFDDLAFWQAELAKLGVGPDAPAVVADDGRMTEAARVWFILQYFGLPAAVLNGGIAALAGKDIVTAPPQEPPVLRPGAGPVGLTDRENLKRDLGSVQVFDARTAAEFRGEDLKGNARGGHLPGAVQLAHSDLLQGSFLRTAPELAVLIAQAGIDGSRPVVTHCNGGGRAALAALAAVMAGQDRVGVYFLSFADWAADESCPIQ